MVEEQRANKSNNYEVRIIGIYAMPSLPILPGGGGVLPYMGYIGMCAVKGMVFK